MYYGCLNLSHLKKSRLEVHRAASSTGKQSLPKSLYDALHGRAAACLMGKTARYVNLTTTKPARTQPALGKQPPRKACSTRHSP